MRLYTLQQSCGANIPQLQMALSGAEEHSIHKVNLSVPLHHIRVNALRAASHLLGADDHVTATRCKHAAQTVARVQSPNALTRAQIPYFDLLGTSRHQ